MKKEVLTFKKEIDISFELYEQFILLKTLIKKYPDISKKILENENISCSFPFICDEFPCDTLKCNGNIKINGIEYKTN